MWAQFKDTQKEDYYNGKSPGEYFKELEEGGCVERAT